MGGPQGDSGKALQTVHPPPHPPTPGHQLQHLHQITSPVRPCWKFWISPGVANWPFPWLFPLGLENLQGTPRDVGFPQQIIFPSLAKKSYIIISRWIPCVPLHGPVYPHWEERPTRGYCNNRNPEKALPRHSDVTSDFQAPGPVGKRQSVFKVMVMPLAVPKETFEIPFYRQRCGLCFPSSK